MFCPDCGTENVDDANFCENCGKRFKKSKLPFIIAGIVIIGIIIVGSIYAFNIGHDAGPVVNNTTSNNITNENKTIKKESSESETKLIDSGKITGYDDVYFNSTYTSTWKTYATGNDLVKIKVNWNFEDADKSFTQTIIIEKVSNSPPEVRISIEPKVSGHSGYETYTSVTSRGYKNILDYYRNSFRYSLYDDPGNRH
ncbi:MAG: zinc ribbon domain-containing protein [Methanobacteriaceae archaeon]|nr:zinc ribbon domain-containing protein [Methanobacteriaceae archaeon]